MSIYKAIASPLDGRQITFTCSIYLIIEAMAPGNDIFDKTGEIPVVLECLEAPAKKNCKSILKSWLHPPTPWFSAPQLRDPPHFQYADRQLS